MCSVTLLTMLYGTSRKGVLLYAPTFFIILCLLVANAQTTIDFWTISLSPTFDVYINETIALYEAQHPNVDVIWSDKTGEQIGFDLLNAVAGGYAPEVININVPMLLDYVEQDLILPITGQFDERIYFEKLLSSLQIDNEMYGLPWYVTPPVVMKNREVFARANVDVTIPVSTLEQLISTATTIKERSNIYGYYPNILGQAMLYRFLEAGLPVLSEDGFTAIFNSPEHVAFLEGQIQLLRQDIFPSEALLTGYGGAIERYQSGNLAMLITGPQFLTRIKNNAPQIYADTEVAPYPLGAGQVIHAPLMLLSIPAKAEHSREGLEFALFVTSHERQVAFSRLTAIFPSTAQAASDPTFTTLPANPTPEDKARVTIAQELKYAKDLTMNLPNTSDLFQYFQKQIEAAFFGYKTSQEALDDAVRFWNAKL
jgi:putative chitobiose transport system substrate-binding protein